MTSQIKVEKYYDVGCDHCGRHLSSDFYTGMLSSVKEARYFAKAEGFSIVNGKTICLRCLRELQQGYLKERDL